mmetsp:Transcript_85458/g.245437  ORF Transcript_85458/g.245437 Transcript_85458/m.245437 type:complete len:234 (+) Transcript_85458:844-1545(+)
MRTTLTPSRCKPSTMLSTAMLESEVARMPSCRLWTKPLPIDPAQDLKMRTAQVVLPVPGGPCTKVTQPVAAARKAAIWLGFMSASAAASGSKPLTLASTLASPGFRASSTLSTCRLGRWSGGSPLPFLEVMPGGAEARWMAASARVNETLLASLSIRKWEELFDSCIIRLKLAGTTGLTMRGLATTTSHSMMGGGMFGSQPAPPPQPRWEFWGMMLTPTVSPFSNPRRSVSVL